jgi:UDP-N-acetylglucosamine 1-carboxyvinyltransferase
VYLGGNFGSSVLATANVMMAAAAADGQTVIEHAACEPEITELALFLRELGVRIEGAGSHCIIIEGVPEFREDDIEFTVLPDRIEAGTYMIMGAAGGNELTLENVPRLHLGCVTDKLESMGVQFEWEPGRCRVIAPDRISPADITTLPYPGFPTDLQAQIMTLLTVASNNSTITEKVYPERFIHVGELNRMGARIRKEGPTAFIAAVDSLSGTQVRASDLRASAALVLAGLMADGQTEVLDIQHLDRGYDNIDEKLRGAGAQIERADRV